MTDAPTNVAVGGASRIVRCAADAFVEAATRALSDALVAALAAREGDVWFAVSGGRTPAPILRALAADPAIDWTRVGVAYVDDRCVPLGDPRSNAGMVTEALASRAPLSGHVVVDGEAPPERAAARYRDALVAALGPDLVFDVAMVGFGPDGHVASLFGPPSSYGSLRGPADHVEGGDPHVSRVTLDFPTLAATRALVLLGSGPKVGVFDAALAAPEPQHALGALLHARPLTAILGPPD